MSDNQENQQEHEHKCFRCEAPVGADDVATGAAYVRDGYYVCPKCLGQIKAGVHPHQDTDTIKSQLAGVSSELRNISQHLHYEHFSWLVLLGAGLQVVVLLLLYRAHGAEGEDKVAQLLYAMVLQLITLTAFVLGKLR